MFGKTQAPEVKKTSLLGSFTTKLSCLSLTNSTAYPTNDEVQKDEATDYVIITLTLGPPNEKIEQRPETQDLITYGCAPSLVPIRGPA